MFPGYSIIGEVSKGKKRIIYRGRREQDGTAVIIKTTVEDYPSVRDMAQLRREYDIIRALGCEGIIKAHAFEIHQNRPMLILEDFDGLPLRTYVDSHQNDIGIFLQIAIELATTVAELHLRNIIHQDLNPKNILVNQATGDTKLIDFGLATEQAFENQQVHYATAFEGTPAYISPEQTGRMNRAIDYRTDLYSLGVTFYEMLTGRLPFEAGDAIEWVHAHIAKSPLPPHEVNPDIPVVISNIVLKLLAKTAEERYQSAIGLKADLETILVKWHELGEIPSFEIARNDFSNRFQIPQRLYGREGEIATLMAAFERVSDGASEMMLVSGYSGIGKSALVHEVHKPIVRQRGHFISGKFDQFKRNIPYTAIIQAFQEMMRRLLTENEVQIAVWRHKLIQALGHNGQIIVDVIPEVELIIGKQAAVPELPPAESQNRFNLVFQRFIQAFIDKNQPLVIFLDDLQWADSATLKLLQALMADRNIRHLFMIGAYRDNEVSPSHPLMLTMGDIEKIGTRLSHITLSPLSKDHLSEFVADTLRCKVQESAPLADLILQKTGGNPFFVTQFLRSLHQESLLEFDYTVGYWRFDLDRIHGLQITDNIVTLMTGKIQKLAGETQRVTRLAACIGNQFDLETLSTVHEKSLRATAADLRDAIRDGLIVPLADFGTWYLDKDWPADTGDLGSVTFRFLHDRVEQAAYDLIPADQRKALQLKVGWLLLRHCREGEREERIFDIVNHLNMGMELITDPAEKDELAQLNLQAGKKAKSSTAYKTALTYLNAGLRLLSSESWTRQYDLTFALHRELAECEYLVGHFERAEGYFELLLKKAQTRLERAEIYNMRIIQCENTAKYIEAVHWGKEGLKLFGIGLPDSDLDKETGFAAETEFIGTHLGEKAISQLIDLPEMTDPEMQMSMKLLMTIWAPAYIAGDVALTRFISAKMVSLSLMHGNSPASAYAYVIHAVTMCSHLRDFKSGHEFGRLALAVNEKFNDANLRAKIHHMFSCFVNFWRKPLKTCFPYSREAYRAGLEVGDFVYATYAVIHESWHALLSGYELQQFNEDYGANLIFLSQIKNYSFADAQRLILHWGLNLQGRTKGKLSFSSNHFDEQTYVETYAGNAFFETFYFVTRLHVSYLFEEYKLAQQMAERAEKVIYALHGTLWDAVLCFYHGLTLAALYSTATKDEKLTYWAKLQTLQATMKSWADNSPENFLHPYLLLSAEMARVTGDAPEAVELYEQAIQSAAETGFIQNQALANELCAKFWLQRNLEKIARVFMTEAVYQYRQWGASAKSKDLEEKYPELLAKRVDLQARAVQLPEPGLATVSATLEALDFTTVLKASQVISGEMDLRRLLQKLMQIVLENTGAQRGFLILQKDNELVVAAEGSVEKSPIVLLYSRPVGPGKSDGDVAPLPFAVINFVKRTLESVVLADARKDQQFGNDPFIIQSKPKSILCVPILNQGRLIAILYLENNLTTDAFTSDRIEVVQILAAQAAISLENARLYEDTKQEIAIRKRAEETLRAITMGTAEVSGGDFFRSLVRHLGSALKMKIAFITECTDVAKTRVRTLAFVEGGEFRENIEYDLADTPCERVIGGNVCVYPDRLEQLFPKEAGYQSYVGVPLLDSAGNLLGHLAVLDDEPITNENDYTSLLKIFAARAGVELERKRAEEALRQSEERFRSGFEHASIGMAMTGGDGRLLSVNKAFCRMLGYSEQELLSRKFQEITFPDDIPESENSVQKVVRGDIETFQIEKRYVHKQGHLIWAITTASVVRDFEGKPWYLFAQIQDITEKKKADEALREALVEVQQLKNRLQAENIYLQEEIKTERNFEEIIGHSAVIKKVTQKVKNVAGTDATVLITGETGTGKELIARAIHNLSDRRERPLIKVNCAALPVGLVESEFFGHEKGAFTGAIHKKLGRFELADGGSIFLDEIGDVPLDVQVKLLRVLQEQEFESVGGTETKKVDMRLIAATNRDLAEAVHQKLFRADLYYRLNVFPIEVPPLRQRKEDIPLLVHFFVNKYMTKMRKQIREIENETMAMLTEYHWPGNIRELSNVIERAMIVSSGPILKMDKESLFTGVAVRAAADGDYGSLDDVERNHILKVLESTAWVINGPKGAAQILGLHPNTLRNRMQKLGIRRKTHRIS